MQKYGCLGDYCDKLLPKAIKMRERCSFEKLTLSCKFNLMSQPSMNPLSFLVENVLGFFSKVLYRTIIVINWKSVN